MSSLNVKLSTKGLANLPTETENPFCFVVGDSQYQCSFCVAAYLSPKIGRLCSLDRSLNEFDIETIDDRFLFERFLSLGRGVEFTIEPSETEFFLSVSEELENTELFSFLFDQLNEELSVGSFISRLGWSRRMKCPAVREIEFLASHFYELSRSDFDGLNIDDVHEILSHPALKLANEDGLFDLVAAHFDDGPEAADYFALLEFVHFEYLSLDTIHRLKEMSFVFVNYLTVSIWERICECLCPRDSRCSSLGFRYIGQPLFSKRSGDTSPLDGIIAFLTTKCGGNVHDHWVVNITSLSCSGQAYLPKNAADLHANTKFGSLNAEGQWLCYEFKTGTIVLTGYTIRSQYDKGPNAYHLKDWVVETSKDGSAWVSVDVKTGNAQLNAQNVTCYFQLPPDTSDECRFVRLRQTGRNHGGDLSIWLSSFEVFGDFFDGNQHSAHA
jgi:hypothetical protein